MHRINGIQYLRVKRYATFNLVADIIAVNNAMPLHFMRGLDVLNPARKHTRTAVMSAQGSVVNRAATAFISSNQ